MNGIDKIIGRIDGDVQNETDAILASARAEAEKIAAGYQAKARAEAEEIMEKGRKAAGERGGRLDSVAQLECRKENLAAKQTVIEEAFALARTKLRAMPEAEYVALLARLAAETSSTGREKLIFSQADRARVGKAVVLAANERLAQKEGMLTLAEETRPMDGGFVLSDGAVEVNCSFEALIRMKKAEITGEVSAVLFP